MSQTPLNPAAQPQPSAAHQRGAVDLSGLGPATPATQPGAAGQGQSWVVEVSEATFDDVARQSLQYPVVLELYSPRDPQGEQVSQALARATNAAQGRWLLGRVNVDVEQRIAQALQATAVPYVIALLGGQAAPLFQGTRSSEEISMVLDQVSQAALANGMTGRAPAQASTEPQAVPGAGQPSVPAADPRFEAADAALDAGDYAAAVAEFDKVLAQSPGDAEAQAGRAQAALLARSMDLNPEQVVADVKADPQGIDANLAAADLEIIGGEYQQAFDRLIGLIREHRGEEREPIRLRVLELFQVMPAGDPVVARARRQLSSALFT